MTHLSPLDRHDLAPLGAGTQARSGGWAGSGSGSSTAAGCTTVSSSTGAGAGAVGSEGGSTVVVAATGATTGATERRRSIAGSKVSPKITPSPKASTATCSARLRTAWSMPRSPLHSTTWSGPSSPRAARRGSPSRRRRTRAGRRAGSSPSGSRRGSAAGRRRSPRRRSASSPSPPSSRSCSTGRNAARTRAGSLQPRLRPACDRARFQRLISGEHSRSPQIQPGCAVRPRAHRTTCGQAGLMFWLTWKTFSGSYVRLRLGEPVVVVPVGRLHPLLALVHHEVDVGAARRVLVQRLPVADRPVAERRTPTPDPCRRR